MAYEEEGQILVRTASVDQQQIQIGVIRHLLLPQLAQSQEAESLVPEGGEVFENLPDDVTEAGIGQVAEAEPGPGGPRFQQIVQRHLELLPALEDPQRVPRVLCPLRQLLQRLPHTGRIVLQRWNPGDRIQQLGVVDQGLGQKLAGRQNGQQGLPENGVLDEFGIEVGPSVERLAEAVQPGEQVGGLRGQADVAGQVGHQVGQ